MNFTAYIALRREPGGEPGRVVIGPCDPTSFAVTVIVFGTKWEILARCHSRKSQNRATRLAEALLVDRFPELVRYYHEARQGRECRCERCGYTAACAPTDDFYVVKGDLVCERCFAKVVEVAKAAVELRERSYVERRPS